MHITHILNSLVGGNVPATMRHQWGLGQSQDIMSAHYLEGAHKDMVCVRACAFIDVSACSCM